MLYKYPYTDLYNLNLDWILQAVKEMQEIVEPLDRIVNSVNGMTGDVVLTKQMLTQILDGVVNSVNGMSGNVVLTKALLTQILGNLVETFNGRTGDVELTAEDVNNTLIDITWSSDPGDTINDLTQAEMDEMYQSGKRVLIFVNNLGVPDQIYFFQWYAGHAQPQAYTPTSALAGVVSFNGETGNVVVTGDDLKTSDTDDTTIAENIDDLQENKADIIEASASGSMASFADGADGLPVKSLKVSIEPVQAGTGDPSPDNIRPITGWTSVKVMRTGKNLFDKSVMTNVNISNTESYLQLKPNTTYIASTTLPKNNRGSANWFVYNSNGNPATTINGLWNGQTRLVTTDNDGIIIVLYRNADFDNKSANYYLSFDFQIELGSTATDYEPYKRNTYDITLPTEAGTVYGGTLDVTNGNLTVDRAVIASYNGESLPGEWISDRDVYAQGTTPTIGAQVVYKLDTPQTYTLTPTEITTLLGLNNVWADAGDVELSYRADTKLYTDQHIAELGPVNDLTSDSTTAALAAAQGKALKQLVNNVISYGDKPADMSIYQAIKNCHPGVHMLSFYTTPSDIPSSFNLRDWYYTLTVFKYTAQGSTSYYDYAILFYPDKQFYVHCSPTDMVIKEVTLT